jgi:hypothetical protein
MPKLERFRQRFEQFRLAFSKCLVLAVLTLAHPEPGFHHMQGYPVACTQGAGETFG